MNGMAHRFWLLVVGVTFLLPVLPGAPPEVVWGGTARTCSGYDPSFRCEVLQLWRQRPQPRPGQVLVVFGPELCDPGLGIYRTPDGGWVLSGVLTRQEIREGLAYLAAGAPDLFWNVCAACPEEGDPWQERCRWWDTTVRSRLEEGGRREEEDVRE